MQPTTLLKKVRAGCYLSSDTTFYAVRMEDNGWWAVGKTPGNHIEDFRTLKEARRFIGGQF
jgi:hypothetical protein